MLQCVCLFISFFFLVRVCTWAAENGRWEEDEGDADLCPDLCSPLTSAAIAADGKHLHQLTKEITPLLPFALWFDLLLEGNNINLPLYTPPHPPARLLFVHRFVYYSLYGKSSGMWRKWVFLPVA